MLDDLCLIESYNLINKTKHIGIKALIDQQKPLKHEFCLLATAIIEDGFCKYSFTPDLIPQLATPSSYAKINLLMQSQFKSKHSLAIYELCKDYVGIEHTPVFSIVGLKNYLGIAPHEYSEFKHFNYKVIKKSIAEINKKSDLSIAIEFGSKKREDFVWFTIAKKSRTIINMQKMIRDALRKNPPILEACPFTQLKELGVSDQKANEIVKVFSIREIQQVFHTMQNNIEKIINPAAWLADAFNKIKKPATIPATIKGARKADEFDYEKALLRTRHKKFVENLTKERWENLSHDRRQTLDVAFEQWIINKNFKFTFAGSKEIMHQVFLEETLLAPQERSIDEWIQVKISNSSMNSE